MKPVDKIAHITTEIQAIDDQVESLRKQQVPLLERRLRLCTELNTIRSMTCSMPPEILSRVIYALIQDPLITIAQTLCCVGAVCTHWRQTVWSSPQLWANIQLIWPARKHSHPKAPPMGMIPLTRLFYENSGSLPVDLSMFSSTWELTQEQAVELMRLVLKTHGKRLRSLLITSLSPVFSDSFIKFASSDLPLLENVEVKWTQCPDRDDHPRMFNHAHRLSCLRMSLPDMLFTDNPSTLAFPWHQLTKLQLRGFNPTHALYILSLCPLLVDFDFSCECFPTGMPNHFEGVDKPVTLTRLERLRWSILEAWLPGEVDGLLLASFVFPSLQELSWGAVMDDINVEQSKLFFACIEKSLKVLRCYRSQRWKTLNVWKRFDYISELRLMIDPRNSPGFKYCDGVSTLQYLTIGPEVNFFPRLQSLHIYFGFSRTLLGSIYEDDEDSGESDISLEYAVVYLLYSRRKAAVDLGATKDMASLIYDPTSDHWQHHQRLERFCFSFSNDGSENITLDWDGVLGELHEVTCDAREKRTCPSLCEIVW